MTYPKDGYPLPCMHAFFDLIMGYQVMSYLDAFLGYQQIKMQTIDSKKIAFIIGEELYYYKVIPFLV